MNKQVIRIPIEDEYEYRWSVDGNRYGLPYDKTIPAGFGDTALEADGWEEVVATNGSTFYTWDGATYAEGLEKSRGVNNQDLSMSCVSTFRDTMALGMGYNGALIFDLQRNIETNLDLCYGAVTGAFGIMMDGVRNEAGKELSGKRNSIYETISGRTIIGYDAVNNAYVIECIQGETGKSGAYGKDLYSECKLQGMTDAICFDGGGSVFMRYKGAYVFNTSRKVKNALILYRRKKSTPTPEPDPEPTPEPTGDRFIVVDSVGMRVREKLAFSRGKATGKQLALVPVGGKAKLIRFIPGIQPDGYQWAETEYNGVTGVSQYDSRCYWIQE